MVTVEAGAINQTSSPDKNRPVIRIDLINHRVRTIPLEHIKSEQLLIIVKAVNVQKTIRDNYDPNDQLAKKILSFRIPHQSDFLYHARGLTIALYSAIRINYLDDEARELDNS